MAENFVTREEHANAINDVKSAIAPIQTEISLIRQQLEKSNEIFADVIKIATDQTHIKEQQSKTNQDAAITNARIDKLNDRLEMETLNRINETNALSQRITENTLNTGWLQRIGGKTGATMLSGLMLVAGAAIKSIFDKG